MQKISWNRWAIVWALLGTLLLSVSSAQAQKVYLNPSDQDHNEVAGGGVESQYAKINADLAKAILDAAGFETRVDQDFTNAPANANSWGADVFVSIHSNAGGGHGTETLYVSSGGQVLAGHVQDGLMSKLPFQSRGLKQRTDLHVLNATDMIACLTETVFHDCTETSGITGHPPSESEFLRSAQGQDLISHGIAKGICTHFGKTCGDDPPPPQKGWLQGVVYRAPNLDDRIGGATVTLDSGQSVTAGDDGAWEFELDPGTYTATASKEGYQPNSSTQQVTAGERVWGSIALTPIEQPQDAGPEASGDASESEDAAVQPKDAGKDASSKDASSRWSAPEPADGCACHVGLGTRASGLLPGALGLLAIAMLRRRLGRAA